MVMLGTALSAVDMQHLRMVVDVVERDELREAALTLGARLCDREPPRSLRFAKETIALAKRSERGLDLRANVTAMLACHTGEKHRAYVARFSRRTG
jgi:enoyl-CoA hydratase/carnithine racemase